MRIVVCKPSLFPMLVFVGAVLFLSLEFEPLLGVYGGRKRRVTEKKLSSVSSERFLPRMAGIERGGYGSFTSKGSGIIDGESFTRTSDLDSSGYSPGRQSSQASSSFLSRLSSQSSGVGMGEYDSVIPGSLKGKYGSRYDYDMGVSTDGELSSTGTLQRPGTHESGEVGKSFAGSGYLPMGSENPVLRKTRVLKDTSRNVSDATRIRGINAEQTALVNESDLIWTKVRESKHGVINEKEHGDSGVELSRFSTRRRDVGVEGLGYGVKTSELREDSVERGLEYKAKKYRHKANETWRKAKRLSGARKVKAKADSYEHWAKSLESMAGIQRIRGNDEEFLISKIEEADYRASEAKLRAKAAEKRGNEELAFMHRAGMEAYKADKKSYKAELARRGGNESEYWKLKADEARHRAEQAKADGKAKQIAIDRFRKAGHGDEDDDLRYLMNMLSVHRQNETKYREEEEMMRREWERAKEKAPERSRQDFSSVDLVDL